MNRRMFLGQAAMAYTSLTEPVLLDENGFPPVRTAPGIGVALNEDVVEERTDTEFRPL
jgi:L-alanine-DL-glutamate epimerase-like enolase superfamily enzyme